MLPEQANTSDRKWLMLGLLFVIYVFNIIDRSIISILLEPIKQDLSLTDAQAGFLAGVAFAIFYTLMGVPIAALADRYSRAKLIAACSVLWSVMTAFTGLASSYFTMALTRMGVGVGEAGLTPSANSLIGDLFKPADRGKAIGIYQSAVPVGTMLAGFVAGALERLVGWRLTFVILGVAGVLLTVLFRILFIEPARGQNDDAVSVPEKSHYSVLETVRFLLGQKSCKYFFPAFVLVGFVAAAVATWTPAYFMRTHNMSLMQMAATIGAIGGIGGAIGMIGGGLLADRLSKRNVAAYMKIPAWAVILTMPFYFAVYLTSNQWLAMVFLLAPMITGTAIVVPALALLQRLVKNNMRAVSVAFFLLVIHLLGGTGPLVVGMISDALLPRYSTDSLRYALLLILPLNMLAAWLLWRAARWVAVDLAITPVSGLQATSA